jgi:transposase
VRRLVGRLGDPRWLRACYEAGPTGYDLARLLHRMDVRCEVIAPSLIPKAPWRQGPRPTGATAAGWPGCTGPGSWWQSASPPCRKKRSGTCAGPGPTWSPTVPVPGTGCAEFLLRHGRAWRGGNAWTLTHERWLLAQHFEQPALAATYAHYRAVLAARDAQLKAIEADLLAGTTGRRSPTRCTAWPPTGASPGWGR